jgi:hypothetical protein
VALPLVVFFGRRASTVHSGLCRSAGTVGNGTLLDARTVTIDSDAATITVLGGNGTLTTTQPASGTLTPNVNSGSCEGTPTPAQRRPGRGS